MEVNVFKTIFNEAAKSYGFESAFGGWFKESNESIVVLNLQKSNFGNYYDINLKIYIQGMFGNIYIRNKDLVKKDTGDVFRRQPPEYKDVLNLDNLVRDETRKNILNDLFAKFIVPFTDKALSKSGIRELAAKEEIALLPAIKEQLEAFK